jgi:hypothetical protein
MVRLFFLPRGEWLRHVVADVEHIRYELITFLIASRDTVSAHFRVVPTDLWTDHGTVANRRPRF